MSTNQGRSIIRYIFDEAFNQGDLAVVDRLVAPDDISHHLSGGMPASRLGLKQWIATLRTAFPDLHCSIEDEIIQGDKIAAHWTMRGTHIGVFMGNPPTGNPIVAEGLIYACLREGQVVENWIMVDQMSILQQLGLVPPPLGPSARTPAEP